MPQYKQAEFARICGVNEAYISTYKKRGKLNINENGLIDDRDPVNLAFMMKMRARHSEPVPEPHGSDEPPQTDQETAGEPSATETQAPRRRARGPRTEGEPTVPTQRDREKQRKAEELLALDKEKKTLDIDIKRTEREVKQVWLEKMRGDVIPTDIVKQAHHRIFSALVTNIRQGAENWLVEIAKKVGLNRNQQAELRGELIKIVNESMDRAVEDAKSSVSAIVAEYRRDTGKGA